MGIPGLDGVMNLAPPINPKIHTRSTDSVIQRSSLAMSCRREADDVSAVNKLQYPLVKSDSTDRLPCVPVDCITPRSTSPRCEATRKPPETS